MKLDICENGIKHVTWELDPAKADRDFFSTLTVSELARLNDYDLEAVVQRAVSERNKKPPHGEV